MSSKVYPKARTSNLVVQDSEKEMLIFDLSVNITIAQK